MDGCFGIRLLTVYLKEIFKSICWHSTSSLFPLIFPFSLSSSLFFFITYYSLTSPHPDTILPLYCIGGSGKSRLFLFSHSRSYHRKIFISRVAVPYKPISTQGKALRMILFSIQIGNSDVGLCQRYQPFCCTRFCPCNEVAAAANYSFRSFSNGPYHCSWTTLAKRQAKKTHLTRPVEPD